ncbi:lycopene cyclase domain-containing protein [Microbacterium gilvum]|uniref:Lycopene cyclase domain-containing protein n=1 Tax=Microbacterium gilvum TaxID=1336204 RepID=A0ABP9A6L5_9MICO
MTYPLLCAIFVGAALLAALLLARRARVRMAAAVIAASALVLLTAVFDNVMIAAGLFAYDDGLISGLRIGAAPVEDFAYPLAAAILLPSVWVAIRARRGAPDAGEETP